jgi:hypothetical protein
MVSILMLLGTAQKKRKVYVSSLDPAGYLPALDVKFSVVMLSL